MGAPQIRTTDLGHEACLDRGVVALEQGITSVALQYLRRAADLRPTRFALVQLAKAHRDLGQLEVARSRLEQARALPDGHSDSFVLVSLAAVLCDLQDFGAAMEVAGQAVKSDPKNAAALKVAERCLREPALALSQSSEIDPAAVARVQRHADELGRRAAEVEPSDRASLAERRRERATQGWLVASDGVTEIPVDQDPAEVVRQVAHGPEDEEAVLGGDSVNARRRSWWQRLKALFGQ
jgi:tetratricopeptide (TPR) repeat protein